MHNNISKRTFCRMFCLNKDFEKVRGYYGGIIKRIYESILVDNMIVITNINEHTQFTKNLYKIGFVYDLSFQLRFHIVQDYVESVKNIFALIESENIDQTHLAFQLIQNLKTFHLNYKEE